MNMLLSTHEVYIYNDSLVSPIHLCMIWPCGTVGYFCLLY